MDRNSLSKSVKALVESGQEAIIENTVFKIDQFFGANVPKTPITIKNCVFQKLEFGDKQLLKEIRIENCKEIKELIFINSGITSLVIRNCNIGKLKILSNEDQNRGLANLRILSTGIDDVNINSIGTPIISIDDFELNYKTPINRFALFIQNSANLNIFNKLINSLILKGNNAPITLNITKSELIEFDSYGLNFSQKSLIRSLNFTKENLGHGKFSLIKCNLKGVSFSWVNFKKYKEIYCEEVLAIDAMFNSIVWPRKIKSNTCQNERDLYRQLKVNLLGAHNIIDSMKFEVLELDAHRKELISNGKRICLNPFSSNCLDRFILFTNKYTSDYGQNFLKPLGWLILFSGVFYFIMLLSINQLNFDETFQFFKIHLGRIFLIINPAHKAEAINTNIINFNWALFWDFISRGFSSYFIFHIIRSLRKYTRR